MSSGGARGRSGPPPDPNALRRDRSNDGEWLTLPPARTAPAPEWPLTGAPSLAEQAHWDREWKRPQATQWERLGLEVEVALYVRSLAEAEIPGAAANLRNLVKQLQENLGLSLPGLQRNRWIIPTTASSSAATAATESPAARPARGRSSSIRNNFRVVPPVESA